MATPHTHIERKRASKCDSNPVCPYVYTSLAFWRCIALVAQQDQCQAGFVIAYELPIGDNAPKQIWWMRANLASTQLLVPGGTVATLRGPGCLESLVIYRGTAEPLLHITRLLVSGSRLKGRGMVYRA